MARKRAFGVSTRLYHGHRLGRDHLLEIGRHGFDAIELFATRTHFDYHASTATSDLQQWLAEARLDLNSVHAPVTERFADGRWGPLLSLASADAGARERAQDEAERALHIARRIPFKVLVVHLGVPRSEQQSTSETSRDAARRSVEMLQRVAEPLGVRVALEVIPNELSRAGSLAHFVEKMLDVAEVGICLDVGHAHMEGDVVDTIETVSEHLMAIDLHDNRGRTDDHLMPFDGEIDWPAVLTTIQKVGYDGTLMLELDGRGPVRDILQRAQRAREKLARLLAN